MLFPGQSLGFPDEQDLFLSLVPPPQDFEHVPYELHRFHVEQGCELHSTSNSLSPEQSLGSPVEQYLFRSLAPPLQDFEHEP